MLEELSLEKYNGDYNLFVEACYNCYLKFWESNPVFEDKIIKRNQNIFKGKEKDFWGIVEGHDESKDYDIKRYERISLLSYLMDENHIKEQKDVLFFKSLHSRKIRVSIFSKSKKYMIVLQEISKTNKLQFITAYPLTTRQVEKKVRQYEEYCQAKGELI